MRRSAISRIAGDSTAHAVGRLVRTARVQLDDASHLRPSRAPSIPAAVERCTGFGRTPSRSLYREIGQHWQWTSRAEWGMRRWSEWLRSPLTETWICRTEKGDAGFAELVLHPDSSEVQITYLGVCGDMHGLGLGGFLLTEISRAALRMPERVYGLDTVRRIWLTTSELDGDGALPNYRARGYRVVEVAPVRRLVRPDVVLGERPWPPAAREPLCLRC